MLPFSKSLEDTDLLSGALLLVDKPKGWTSFDAVNKIKNLVRRKYQLKKFKIGHSGTLDPMATGLLLICTGGWTKKLHELQGFDKRYHAKIRLGIETNTYDAEGDIVFQKEVPTLKLNDLNELLQSFLGEIDQFPPAFSAIKKDGKPLYELARAGKEVKLEPRKVKLYEGIVREYQDNTLTVDLHSGSGFYVRSLAHDLGLKLGCGAHLCELRRDAIGEYKLDDAWKMDEIVKAL